MRLSHPQGVIRHRVFLTWAMAEGFGNAIPSMRSISCDRKHCAANKQTHPPFTQPDRQPILSMSDPGRPTRSPFVACEIMRWWLQAGAGSAVQPGIALNFPTNPSPPAVCLNIGIVHNLSTATQLSLVLQLESKEPQSC